jgi:hypothetical protein
MTIKFVIKKASWHQIVLIAIALISVLSSCDFTKPADPQVPARGIVQCHSTTPPVRHLIAPHKKGRARRKWKRHCSHSRR